MLLAKGSKVRLKNSGDLGVVTAILDADMVQIKLEGEDLEIPIFIDDLERPNANNQHIQHVPSAAITAPQQEHPSHQYEIIQGLGWQLGFVYHPTPNHYEVYLINDLHSHYAYSLQRLAGAQSLQTKNGQIQAGSFQYVSLLPFHQLNDSLNFKLEVWEKLPLGSGAKQIFELKLKAQHFFKTPKTLPLVNQPGFNFTFKKKEKPTAPETLQSLAKSTKIPRNPSYNRKDELLEKADFSIELDLHYEALPQQGIDRRNPPSILKYQLEVFDHYIAKAKNLGIEKVFIIHGVGTGVLKKALQDRMKWNPAVTKYTNEYHPKYGFGATEVILGG